MPTTLIVSCQSHLMVQFPKLNISMFVTLCIQIYADRNKTRSRCRYIVVSTDGSWLNISKFIGSQLRATSYRVKRAECYKVVADTPNSNSHVRTRTKTRSMRRYPTLHQSLYRAYQRSAHTRLYPTKRNRCSQLHNISL